MENIWESIQYGIHFFLQHFMFWNVIFAIIIVFFQRREPKSVWAWLLLLYFIPILGFLFYLLLGADLHKRKMFRVKEVEDRLNETVKQQEYKLKIKKTEELNQNISNYKDLIMYNLETSGSVLTEDNKIQIFTDGKEKFTSLVEDIRNAKEFVHIQYYIIKNDILFQRIKDVLIEKAAEGVEIRLLFDAMGCRTVRHSSWKKLNELGVMTAEFFPAIFRRFQIRMNYRNHRKIVIIDNKLAYVGGFNIGREYIGLDDKFGYWRDTHLKIEGGAVASLHLRFLLDWNYASKENLFLDNNYFTDAVPCEDGHCDMQIISSGPDNASQQIRDNYLRLIHKAKNRIYIQTPYFIPDESIFDSLKIAIRSGIEVNVMIPCKPDHPFIYWATYSYIGELVMAGANCYTYDNGFLHCKGMIIDEEAFCYGTANMDIRSFALNFEVNAIVYDAEQALLMKQIFIKDLEYCTKITKDMYASRRLLIRAKEQICRLLSPLL